MREMIKEELNPTTRFGISADYDKLKIIPERRYNEIIQKLHDDDPTHYERVWLVSYLKWIGFTAEQVMEIIEKHNNWLDYNPDYTWYQICSIFKITRERPKIPKRIRHRNKLPPLPTTPNQRKKMQETKDWIMHQRILEALREKIGIVWYPWEIK